MKVYYLINKVATILVGLFTVVFIQNACADPIRVVAAENMYGNIAQQLGGKYVQVNSILEKPDQDPHLFELTPTIGQNVVNAKVMIVNGLGYDSWMDRLLSKYHFNHDDIIVVQNLLGRKDGDNPHLWYDLKAANQLSQRLEQIYIQLEPKEKDFFTAQLKLFIIDINKLNQRIQIIRKQYPDVKVGATEPVFGLMAQQLGFQMQEEPYQWVVMNGGEPSPKQVAQFIQDLKKHQIQILFYNDQVVTPATQQLKRIAMESRVPVVGVSETMPIGLTYQQWMNQVLDKVEDALKSMPK